MVTMNDAHCFKHFYREKIWFVFPPTASLYYMGIAHIHSHLMRKHTCFFFLFFFFSTNAKKISFNVCHNHNTSFVVNVLFYKYFYCGPYVMQPYSYTYILIRVCPSEKWNPARQIWNFRIFAFLSKIFRRYFWSTASCAVHNLNVIWILKIQMQRSCIEPIGFLFHLGHTCIECTKPAKTKHEKVETITTTKWYLNEIASESSKCGVELVKTTAWLWRNT